MLIRLLLPLILFTHGSIIIMCCFFSTPWPLLGAGVAVSWLYLIAHQRWKIPLEPLWLQLLFLVFLLLSESSKLTRDDISMVSFWLGLFMLVFCCLQELLLALMGCYAFYFRGSDPQQEVSLMDLPRILELPLFFVGNGLAIMAESFLSESSILWRLIGGFLMTSAGETTFYLFTRY